MFRIRGLVVSSKGTEGVTFGRNKNFRSKKISIKKMIGKKKLTCEYLRKWSQSVRCHEIGDELFGTSDGRTDEHRFLDPPTQ